MIKSWVNNPQSHDMILITDANPLRWDPSHNQILPSNPTELCFGGGLGQLSHTWRRVGTIVPNFGDGLGQLS